MTRHYFFLFVSVYWLLSFSVNLLSQEAKSNQSIQVFELGLDKALSLAVDNSHTLTAKRFQSKAQEKIAQSQKARRFPKLDIEASFAYMTNVGKIDAIPGTEIKMGDNYTYSVGPVVNWIVWDFGRISNSWKSLDALKEAQIKEYDVEKRKTVLQTRLTYYKVQLSSEQLKLVADSLRLAKSQYNDISTRHKAGAASRLDLLSSHQEVIDFKRTFEVSQNDLSTQIRELFAIVGRNQEEDISFPVDARIGDVESLIDEKPNLLLKLDSIDESLKTFVSKEFSPVDVTKHPLVESTTYKSQSAGYASESAKSQHWPTLTLQAKSSLDYPNTPKLENYNQNRVGLLLAVPVFEWGRVKKEVESQNLQAKMALEQKTQIEIDLTKEWHQIKDRIRNLKSQQILNNNAKEETFELAGLIYKSYLAGRSNHLEVQRANLRALQAKVESARTNTQLLIEMARLASLANEEI